MLAAIITASVIILPALVPLEAPGDSDVCTYVHIHTPKHTQDRGLRKIHT